MTLRVYNTLSGEKELFEPVVPGKVGMYLCGPTVYKPSHIGHAVGPVIFDTIKRYLSFKGYKVTWVVNVTDVDDKLIVASRETGRTVPEIARDMEKKYVEAMAALGVRSIDQMPRASEHIREIVSHIQQLIDRAAAYVVGGDVYFDVSKDADYGKLSNRKSEEQFAGTREGLVQAAKRNSGDFALWKGAKPDEPPEVQYDSPWGKGRPGWHIECSAMAMRYLGQTFDIHGGGLDLKFPHHENEIAQAETATGKVFAKYWLHNGLTRFNTKKISKSDPDFEKVMESLQLSNLLAKHPPELLRYLIIQSHYRSPIDFSDQALSACKSALDSLYRLLERVERATGADPYSLKVLAEHVRDTGANPPAAELIEAVVRGQVRFLEAMDDDFNTAGAIGVLFEMAGHLNRYLDATRLETNSNEPSRLALQGAAGTFLVLARLLGLLLERPSKRGGDGDAESEKLMGLFIEIRKMARDARQFQIADAIRNRLSEIGFVLEDGQDGTRWRRA
ncbi:MAG: cysteine--tRNA ligase [Planctomycetota bacterium]|nr:MAG: cysteine--tRNA ligase [Planctomycetota bacterium]